ncbi:MAG TPA: glycosyltransferase family 2 protein [Alphaproteobacteria bacterium]|jgi:undecaprenyl-phosphate 4-deoxy-4-formamido-L-arabinose transferase|nr:glycosyltransferase family 2 protein [Alphaproteobacteria bacterium]
MTRPYALSIVVPVYNGARTVGALVDALAGIEIRGGHEVVLVNDGSPDDSEAVCRELARRSDVPVTFVNLARNFGEHNAVMAGFSFIRGDYVITMDDDLQNPPEEVARLLEHTRSNDLDVVYTRYKTKQHAAWRNLGSRFANWAANLVLEKPKDLYLSSFRCVSAFVVDNVLRYQGPYPYIDGLILQVTRRVGSLEVQHLPRAEGRSNYTLRRLVRLWLNMFVNFSIIPLRFSALLGFITSILGLAWSAFTIIEAVRGRPPEGWASLMVAVLLLSGVQLILLGVVGEYVGRVFLSANRKPQYVVRDATRLRDGETAR